MHALNVVLLSLVAFVSAYTVTVPSQNQGWTNNGAQTLSWTMVSTDPATFDVVLINQASFLFLSFSV
jgi:hypothetical protein